MRKKSLLLLLLMAMFAPWAAMAQETVEIGTDGGTTNNSYLPGYTLYDNTLSEQIYTAEEVTMAGTISSIAFYNGGSTKSPTVTLYMVNTDKEAFSSTSDWLTVTSSDKVYEGSVTFTAGEWTTITLDTPFDYDGSSNLGLVAHVHMDQYSSGLSCRVFTSTDNCSMYAYRDNTVYNPTNPGVNASGRLGVKNQIKLEITPSSGVVCDKPETFEASNVTSNSATLTWTGGSGNYNVEYKLASDAEWTSFLANTTATTCNLTGLTPGSAYQARVQSVCDDATSGWKSVSFQTMFALPINEPFTTTSVPNGWTRYSGLLSDVMGGTALTTTTSGWLIGNYNNVFDTHTRVNIYGDGCKYWLVTPSVTMENNVQLSFDLALTVYTSGSSASPTPGNQADDKFVVLITTDNMATWTVLRQWDNVGSEYVYDNITNNAVGENITIDLSSYAGQSIAVAFYGESTVSGGDNNLHIDNVSIDYIPACAKPTGLAVTQNSVTAHEATITWTSDAGAWQVQLNDEDPIDVEESTYTFTELAPETTYTAKVRANCDGTYSDWTNAVNFTTAIACPVPTSLVVNYQGGTSATFTWTETGSATSWDIQYSTTADFNDITTVNVYDNPSFELTGLALATTYYVRVNAFCDADGISAYTNVVSFTTDLCMPENQCLITFDLTDSYGDGWNGAYIEVVDVLSEASLGTFTNQNLSKAAETETYTLAVCDGRSIKFVWHSGNYDDECSFVIKDVNEEVIVSGTSSALPFNHTVSCTVTDCRKPTDLTATEIKAISAKLSWTENGVGEEPVTAWVLAYKAADDETFTEVNATENPFTLENLAPETEYTWKVRSNGCDDMWSEEETFTTLEECPTPTNVTVSNIGHYSATVNWTGDSEEFTVMYRETATMNLDGINEGFEDGTMPNGWTSEGPGTWTVGTGDYSTSTGAHSGTYNAKINHGTNNDVTYLVTPNLDLSGQSGLNVNLWYINRSWSGDTDGFGVYYRIDGGAWNEIFATTEATTVWTEVNEALPADAYTTNCQIGFKFTDGYGYGVSIDDILIGNPTVNPAGEWQTVTTDETTANLSGLAASTKYDVKVVPNCDDTHESDIVCFTTVSENVKYFITEGDWGTAANWEPAGAPTIEQTVELRANATITGEAEAKSIAGTGTGEGTYTLTIENGGKLKHLNSGVTATVKKTINPWTENGGYYLIANPTTANYTPKADGTDGILAGNYDLYSWDYAQEDEWRNYKANAFSYLNSSNYTPYGYLYANEAGTTLSITGTIKAANASLYRYCSATTSTSYDFPGWYLLGNGFVCDAYLAAESATGNALPFIRMKADGTGFENVAAGTAINPFEGVFFEASSEEGGYSGYVYVTTTQPTVQNDGKLNIDLRSANKQLDNAILVFGGNQRLGKMSFRANSSKIYMPVEGKDYAITNAEGNMGEMPVSFKAENNGTYSLSFNAEEVSFAYLHLIDNMTGNDVNLLETPSYSFEASTTDYANRFKLVFATGNNGDDDTFAFFSNGSFVINNEGNATVQVIDVNGRILSSETINGCANLNVKAAAGVYMIRLVNGDNVKVQKVVVR